LSPNFIVFDNNSQLIRILKHLWTYILKGVCTVAGIYSSDFTLEPLGDSRVPYQILLQSIIVLCGRKYAKLI
jgi:hypothetical protein